MEHFHPKQRHAQVPKEEGSRMQQMIRDRVVGSEWFKTFVMLVIVFNSLLLWPWTDAEKQQELSIFNVYSAINLLFIIVYLAELILKVCLCSVLIRNT